MRINIWKLQTFKRYVLKKMLSAFYAKKNIFIFLLWFHIYDLQRWFPVHVFNMAQMKWDANSLLHFQYSLVLDISETFFYLTGQILYKNLSKLIANCLIRFVAAFSCKPLKIIDWKIKSPFPEEPFHENKKQVTKCLLNIVDCMFAFRHVQDDIIRFSRNAIVMCPPT